MWHIEPKPGSIFHIEPWATIGWNPSSRPGIYFLFQKVDVPAPPGAAATYSLKEGVGGVWGERIPHTGGVFGLSSHYLFRLIMKLTMAKVNRSMYLMEQC